MAQAAGRERVALIEVFNRVALVPGELGWTGSVCKHDMKCCHCQLLTRLQQEFACSSTYSNQPCHMVRPRLSRTPHRSRSTGQLLWHAARERRQRMQFMTGSSSGTCNCTQCRRRCSNTPSQRGVADPRVERVERVAVGAGHTIFNFSKL